MLMLAHCIGKGKMGNKKFMGSWMSNTISYMTTVQWLGRPMWAAV
jgi:hypothetical protein